MNSIEKQQGKYKNIYMKYKNKYINAITSRQLHRDKQIEESNINAITSCQLNYKKQNKNQTYFPISDNCTQNKYFKNHNLKYIELGKTHRFEGRGCTEAIDTIYKGKLVGRVIFSPFCQYGKFSFIEPNKSHELNSIELNIIEIVFYRMWLLDN